jgi:isoleucyl-tRNA synthetase
MSKSQGNAIAPQDVIKQSGADILRLWVATSDYQEESRVSKEILARVSEAYRKIRNTLRYLIANLYDFDPERHSVDRPHLEEVDRYILARYAEVSGKILKAYEEYEYSTIFQAINAFTTVDLSAFYVDVSKDRLYTFAAGSKDRRSAQTAMYTMADGLARLLAPILSFSADELWRYLPGKREESVHLALFPAASELATLRDPALEQVWEGLIKVRDQVLGEIEPLRKDKQIGSSLQARVVLSGDGADMALLTSHRADLPMLFIVSDVELGASQPGNAGSLQISIEKATGLKCERCWRYVPNVTVDASICDRCQGALAESVSS